MSPRRDFLVRCLAAFLTMLVVAPVFGAFLPRTPFHRVMTRCLQVAIVVVFLVGAGRIRTWPGKLKGYGFGGPHGLKRFLVGAAVAATLFALLIWFSYELGGRGTARGPDKSLLVRFAKALFAGVMVAYYEEFLFRGFLKDRLGGLWSAFLYGAVHYFKPLVRSAPAPDLYDPLLAIKRLGLLFESWTDLRQVVMGIGSLFVFGLALNRMRDRSGSLYLGMGVHAGVVFALAMYRHWIDGKAVGSLWIHGGTRIHDGLIGFLGLGILWALATWAPLPKHFRGCPPQ